jgi:hypothetical protein
MTFTCNETIDLQLDAFQTFQIQTDGDLTGSYVTSDRPISVVSGSSRSTVPYDLAISPTSDHLEEMIPPLFAWGKRFLTVPLAGRTAGDIFRILGNLLDSRAEY